jgi:hypothetical protein
MALTGSLYFTEQVAYELDPRLRRKLEQSRMRPEVRSGVAWWRLIVGCR